MQSLQPAPIGWNCEPAWQYSQSIPSVPPPIQPTPASQTGLKARANSTSAHDAAERSTSQKRRACNECRQQKLRCELANVEDPSATICSRCTKLGLECRIDDSFKRTRKRKRSVDFEKEIHSLKKQLSRYESGPSAQAAASSLQTDSNARGSGDVFPTTVPNGTSPESPENSLPGTTTRPHEHEVQAKPEPMVSSTASSSRPRSLGNVEVSVEEANELFALFFTNYHPFLPVLNATRCSQAYYESSPLLFWSILAVAARRYQSNPTLLPRLAQTVPDLLWKTIRSIPHSLSLVQSLLVLCTWPFPTSSSATDPSYMLAGIAVHSSLQMGLHRPTHQQDFTKYRVRLSNQEVSSRISIWTACNIVAQCVSIGVGLQTPAHLHDWASIFGLSPDASLDLPDTLRQFLQIESFRNKVTQAFAMNSTDEVMTRPTHERLPMYKLFENDLAVLEANLGIMNDFAKFHLRAARLHFQTFFLFDESNTSGYEERILALYLTAARVIEHALEIDRQDQNFMHHCPSYAYQTFVCASFVLLKILKSEHFSALVEAVSGKKLFNSSISALRKMSVSNNDLPGRLSDVLAYLWTHPNPNIVCGEGMDGLQLKIKSRMSMSIVYDSLWLWRNQFVANGTISDSVPSDALRNESMEATTPGMFQFDDINALPTDDLFFDWFR